MRIRIGNKLFACSLPVRLLVSYPRARYLSACSLPIRVRVDAWELPTHGHCNQSQHLTAALHKFCVSLQPGRGTKLSPLSLLAAKTGQNSPCMRKTAQNARFLASRANFVTRAPPNRPRRANFVTENAPKRQCRTTSVPPSAAGQHVTPCVRTSMTRTNQTVRRTAAR